MLGIPLPERWGRTGAGKRCATTWKGDSMGMTEYDLMMEKRAAAYAEQHNVSMRAARKAVQHKGHQRKRTASMKVKR